eukprot:TRINITY_DN696_c0_g1_i1.p1 TRINITY_DN696_c0_g1~~TRINITY_DN696_c0_g1_i1.p1  ORF type:complete len:621 (-),score=112.90 TRINITY_DN696_c0_g1_i1:10-1872(-)
MARDGQLFVLVLEGRNIIARDWGGSSDPYCKVYFDKTKQFKTKFILKCLEPKWEEQARHLPLTTDKNVENVKFSLWDYDRFKWDEFLGEVLIPINDLLDGVPRDEWFPLNSRRGKHDKVSGELHLQLLFLEPGDSMTSNYEEFPYPLQTLMAKKKHQPFKNALARGLDLEVPDREGNRPLHAASNLDQPDCVRQLLEKGASLTGKDANGATPLHTAAAKSNNSIPLLLSKGAQLTATDDKGRTPLHYAAAANNANSINSLLEKGAAINAQDTAGHTPLHRALLEKQCYDAIRALVEKGADIYLEDKSGRSCAGMCMDERNPLVERTKKEFMSAVGIKDDREFEIRRKLQKVYYVEGTNLSADWKENEQFSIAALGDTSVIQILMHYVYEEKTAKQMEKTGFMVVLSDQGVHKEPSYQQDLIGYGYFEPFDIKVEKRANKDTFYIMMPYAKSSNVKGYYDMIIYSDGELDIKQLVKWKCSIEALGEWTPELSGGSRSDDVSWFNNPQFTLTLPQEQDSRIDMTILLSQAKAALDIIPYSLVAYQFYIGYYIFDRELFDVVVQCDKWKNAQETYIHFSIDTTKDNEFIIIPTTHLPGQLTTFTLTILSDIPVQLTRRLPPPS